MFVFFLPKKKFNFTSLYPSQPPLIIHVGIGVFKITFWITKVIKKGYFFVTLLQNLKAKMKVKSNLLLAF